MTNKSTPAPALGDVLLAMLSRIDTTLTTIAKQQTKMSAQLEALTAQVAANITVEQSALTLIHGIQGQISAAVAAALANGATPAVLADLTALSTSLQASDVTLAAAVTADTPTQ